MTNGFKTIESTYKTEFYFNGVKLFEKDYFNLKEWGKGATISHNEEDYRMVDIPSITNDMAKVTLQTEEQWFKEHHRIGGILLSEIEKELEKIGYALKKDF